MIDIPRFTQMRFAKLIAKEIAEEIALNETDFLVENLLLGIDAQGSMWEI